MWFFAVLEGNDYTLSNNNYSVTVKEDQQQIVKVLKKKIEQIVR